MPITNNIGGVNKDSTPKININGTYKGINTGKVNIDGVYKQFYPREVYTIKIYRNGSLYSTLTCQKGDSIILPSNGAGYAVSSSSTTITYECKQTITPSSNLNLYIVYQYGFNIYRYGSLFKQQIVYSQALSYTVAVQSITGISNMPTFKGYSQSSSSNEIFVRNNGSVICSKMVNLYAVYEYKLNLYKYGDLIKTIVSTSQSNTNSIKLPGCEVDSDDKSFYGWTKINGDTSKQYSQDESISINLSSASGTNLYAIFEYLKSYSTATNNIYSNDNTVKTITLPCSGDVIFSGGQTTVSSGTQGGVPNGSNNSSGSYTTGTSAPYIKANGVYQIITLKLAYSDGPAISHTEYFPAGSVIEICGHSRSESTGTSYTGGTTTYIKEIKVTYITKIINPVYGYRSTK